MSDKAETPLRARLAEAEAAEARRHIDPLLRELKDAAQLIRASARVAERAALHARRGGWQRTLTMFALGALLMASALSLVPERWKLSPSARRHQYLGQRLEHVWTALEPERKEEMRALLGLADRAGQQR